MVRNFKTTSWIGVPFGEIMGVQVLFDFVDRVVVPGLQNDGIIISVFLFGPRLFCQNHIAAME